MDVYQIFKRMKHIKKLAKYSPSKFEYEKQTMELLQRFYQIYRYQKNTTFNYNNKEHYNLSINEKAQLSFWVSDI